MSKDITEELTIDEMADILKAAGITGEIDETCVAMPDPVEIRGDVEIPLKFDEVEKTLVAVQYRDKNDKTIYGGRQYTYYTKLPLKEGDIVKCPTKFGASIGKVCRLNVPESEVAAFKDALKEIEQYHVEEEK